MVGNTNKPCGEKRCLALISFALTSAVAPPTNCETTLPCAPLALFALSPIFHSFNPPTTKTAIVVKLSLTARAMTPSLVPLLSYSLLILQLRVPPNASFYWDWFLWTAFTVIITIGTPPIAVSCLCLCSFFCFSFFFLAFQT